MSDDGTGVQPASAPGELLGPPRQICRVPAVADYPQLQVCDARLLGVSPAALASALTRRRLSVRNQNVIMRTQSLQQARDSCDALARCV